MASEGGRRLRSSRIAENVERVSFDIPDDPILEILSRLPVKSVLRFKSVCKSWNVLIRAPHFIQKLQTNSTLNPHILLFHNLWGGIKQIMSFHCISSPLDHPINLDFPALNYFRIVGVSCGLVLGHNFHTKIFIIANPMTRQFHPFIWPFRLHCERNVATFFGFGVLGNSQHLVRVIGSSHPNGQLSVMSELFVMDMVTGVDIWRKIDVRIGEGALLAGNILFLACRENPRKPVFINGIFYWEAYTSRNACVASFDIIEGLFDVITHTPPFNGYLVRSELGEINGELSLIRYHGGTGFELFVMNEKNKSWSLRYEWKPMLTSVRCRGRFRVVGCIKNDKFVLEDRLENWVRFLLLDLSTGRIRYLFDSETVGKNFEVYLCSESLLSINNN